MKALRYFLGRAKFPYWSAVIGLILSFMTAFSSVALLALSAWFITATAVAGLSMSSALAFNYFLPALGVRIFSYMKIGGRYLERLRTHAVTFQFLTQLRVSLYARLVSLKPNDFYRLKLDRALHYFSIDITLVNESYLKLALPIVNCVLIFLLIFLLYYYFLPTLAYIFLIYFLLLLSVLLLSSFLWGKQCAHCWHDAESNYRARFFAALRVHETLCLFQAASRTVTALNLLTGRCLTLKKRLFFFEAVMSLVVEICLYCFLLLLLFSIKHFPPNQIVNGPVLFLLLFSIIGFYEVVAPVLASQYYILLLKEAVARLYALYTLPKEGGATECPLFTAPTLLYEDVVLHYPGQTNLRWRLPLVRFEYGSSYFIYGETGSGKTTLINLLAKFYLPTEGKISLGGVSLNKISEKAMRNLVSIVPQDPSLIQGTLRENLHLANADASDSQLSTVLNALNLTHLITLLDTYYGEFGATLSGGEQKRLAVAQILLRDSFVYVFDEVTEGLDAKNSRQLIATIHAFLPDKMILFLSHDRSLETYFDHGLCISACK